MNKVLREIQSIQSSVPFNADHLNSLSHTAKRYAYMSKLQLDIQYIAQTLGDLSSSNLPLEQQKQFTQTLIQNRKSLENILKEYPSVWLERNKYPSLDTNLDKLHRQLSELQGFIVQTQNGTLHGNAKPIGTWFWQPSQDTVLEHPERTVYFVHTFDLPEQPLFAELKGWADDEAHFFINGNHAIGADYFSPARDKNITTQLKKGQNILAVKGLNQWGVGGIILELRIKNKDQSNTLITADTTWVCTTTLHDKWNATVPKDNDWVPVKILGKGIISPYEDLIW
jgi:hypothetical protein